MRNPSRWGVMAVFVVAACGPSLKVQTVVRPEADLRAYRTFNVLVPPPAREKGVLNQDHPMRVNSLSNRELRTAIVDGLWDRGYWLDEQNPDLMVAYYASQDDPLDATQWDYGYGCRLGWWRAWEFQPGFTETAFPPGTVIVDVLDGRTGGVVWRGLGVVGTSRGDKQYRQALAQAVQEMLTQLPGPR